MVPVPVTRTLLLLSENTLSACQVLPNPVRLNSSITAVLGKGPKPNTWKVRPLIVLLPLSVRVTLSWCGPGKEFAGTVAVMEVSLQAVVGRATPSNVTWPAVPKPWPLIVKLTSAVEVVKSAYGLDTANSSGLTGAAAGSLTVQATWLNCPPGSWTVRPTCVGAKSAGTIRPG
jgi:hypothetical protein